MAHPLNMTASQIDANPFLGMKISEPTVLNNLEGRRPCPKCGKSRKYFCYTCYVPIDDLSDKLPVIKVIIPNK